jgi:hypothetical protein
VSQFGVSFETELLHEVHVATRSMAAQPRNRGSITGRDKNFFISPISPDNSTVHPTSSAKDTAVFFFVYKSGRFLKLNSHLHLVSSLKMNGVVVQFLICLHDVHRDKCTVPICKMSDTILGYTGIFNHVITLCLKPLYNVG